MLDALETDKQPRSYEEVLEHKIRSLYGEVETLKTELESRPSKLEIESLATAMALFVRFVTETMPETEKQAEAYRLMLLDIADETWGFPNEFEAWRRKNGV
jgi:hypothetical protein